jgi:hypothetical protein
MILANSVFSAFHAAYVSWLFMVPLVVLVVSVEAIALWAFNRQANFWAVAGCALLMNVVSWLLGVCLAPHLLVEPGLVEINVDETGHGYPMPGPQWGRLARLSFLQAGVLSIIIEALTLPLRGLVRLRRVDLPVVLGNLVSYVALYLGFVLSNFGRWGSQAVAGS